MNELPLDDLLGSGPRTAEALHRDLIDRAPRLAARGVAWLENELRRLPNVRALPGGRFELVEITGPQFQVDTDRRPRQMRLPIDRSIGERFVVLDLEANPDRGRVEEHEILEIGACLVERGRVVAEFSRLCRPTRPVVDMFFELTGIAPDELDAAADLTEALKDLASFVGDLPLVAHNGFGYDFPLLDASMTERGVEALPGIRLDTLQLAHLAAPRSGHEILRNADGTQPPAGRSLDDLAAWLGIEHERAHHRAVDDARLTVSVLTGLVSRLGADEPQRVLQRHLLERGSHPWAAFLAGHDEVVPLEQVLPDAPSACRSAPIGEFDPYAAAAALGPDGAVLAQAGRRYRPQQHEMAQVVAGALARGQRWMVEAPTGTGKTLAYLVPAIEWARASGGPVLIATHSKVLQNQILTSIAELEEHGDAIAWTLVKGKDNYLSIEALAGAIDADPADADEAFGLATIVGWAATTPTGDWDDLNAWLLEEHLRGFAALKWRLRVETAVRIPRNALQERCFHRRALRRLADAEIAVLNHAVLVARDDVLEDVAGVVIDEAHNFEESATAALTSTCGREDIERILRTVHDPARGWGTVGRYCQATGTNPADEKITAILDARARAVAFAENFAAQIVDYVRDRSTVRSPQIAQFGTSHHIQPGLDTSRPDYAAVRRTAGKLSQALIDLAEALGSLAVPEQLLGRYRRERLEGELARVGRSARASVEVLSKTLDAADHASTINLVSLTLDDRGWSWNLQRVPIEIGPQLADLWNDTKGLVLTSATLRISGSFSFLTGRLGLGAVQTKALDSPFDRLPLNEIVLLPGHLPTPRGGLLAEFAAAEAQEIARLFQISRGRGLALFTARSRMLSTRDTVRPVLDPLQLPVLCQGDEPSPSLVDRMRSETRTSLLATRSFWEGIDIPGEALSLLVIEKLPFDSPADPVVAARMDAVERRGHDPFGDYLVPQAVLRFTQGVGRLIRRDDDRGAVVVLDKRLRRPSSYREAFLSSLPGPPRVIRPENQADCYRELGGHLGIELDDEFLARLLETADIGALGLADLLLSDEELADPAVVDARLEAVRDRLGLERWRPGQLEVITRFIRGEDVLAVLPTGTGKSLTYQIPALLRPGLTLVISPLVALMRDQVENLRDRGVPYVAAVYSGQSQAEQEEVLDGARAGRYRLLYVSPERLWSQRFRSALAGVEVKRIAIDEAHCIPSWGHSFRPEYLAIPEAVRSLTVGEHRPAVLAATATATPPVREEIVERLGLRLTGAPVIGDPDRPELAYYVERCADMDDRDLRVVQILDAFRGRPAIVYVPRQKDTVRLSNLLRAADHAARPYHGGLEAGKRIHIEEAFRDGEIDVVVATKAFGLGIDKPDIALVLHLEMPLSVEEYIQETGRAARGAVNGTGPEVGTCVLLTAPRDMGIHWSFIKGGVPERGLIEAVWEECRNGEQFRPLQDLASAVGRPDEREAVALAVHYLVQSGALLRHADIASAGKIWVGPDAEAVFRRAVDRGTQFPPGTDLALAEVLRRGSSEYRLGEWQQAVALPAPAIERALLELARQDVIGFPTWETAMHLEPKPVAGPDWAAIDRSLLQRRQSLEELSGAAKRYARGRRACRRHTLLTYLGFTSPKRCAACDICVPDLPRPWARSEVTLESLTAALPTEAIVLAFLFDIDGANYSQANIHRTLLGESGQYELPSGLATHHQFGVLAPLGWARLVEEVQALTESGLVETAQVESDDPDRSPWITLRLTDKGRGLV